MKKGDVFMIGHGVSCDLERLVSSRLLIQANSGGGKSWALRRFLEQTHGRIQQIVIDPEGEFASLREKFDYILAAKQGGDTAADPRTAKLLAERLLELGVSAVVDIYELNPDERIRFVKIFVQALVDAPKALWHPVLVVIDEAHIYAPEKESAESAGAVKALCSRGRKRGFCAVLATQRLSKLAKDAAAECSNKLIGRTVLDVDIKRAGEELGFDKADRLELRNLGDGEFFAFGPAIGRDVMKVKVGPVQTSHPKAGSQLASVVPPPTAKVKALLPKLSDLPAEAEAREKSLADLQRDNHALRRQVKTLEDSERLNPNAVSVVEVLTTADRGLIQAFTESMTARHEELTRTSPVNVEAIVKAIVDAGTKAIAGEMVTFGKRQSTERDAFVRMVEGARFLKVIDKIQRIKAQAPSTGAVPVRTTLGVITPAALKREPSTTPTDGVMTDGMRRILDTVQILETRQIDVSLTAICAWMDINDNGGRFRGNLKRLLDDGFLADDYHLTESGRGVTRSRPTGIEAAKAVLTEGQRRIVEVVEASTGHLSIDGLALAMGIKSNGGRFRGNVTRVRDMGLVTSGAMRVTDAAYR